MVFRRAMRQPAGLLKHENLSMSVAVLLGYLNSLTLVRPREGKLAFVGKRILQKAKRGITRLYDPIVQMQLNERTMLLPLSHNLPNLLSEKPNYDCALPRLARLLHGELGALCMIDVGANIGDTVNAIDQAVKGSYLCIEPCLRFFKLLQANTRQIDNAKVENLALGERNCEGLFRVQESNGTGRLLKTDGDGVAVWTLDALLSERYPDFLSCNLLKIDTDGYDFRVLRGSRKVLSRSKPVVFFELSPDHLIHVAQEDPMSIFSDLMNQGYRYLLFYDNNGYPIAPLEVDQREVIKGLLNYVHRRPSTYLDVAAFHEEQMTLFGKFVRLEVESIPVYTRPYFL
jgi:FkbM family methyltransferase